MANLCIDHTHQCCVLILLFIVILLHLFLPPPSRDAHGQDPPSLSVALCSAFMCLTFVASAGSNLHFS